MHKFEITNAEGGTAFLVQVTASSEANSIAGKDSDVVFVNLDAPKEQEAINQNLCEFLAQKLQLPTNKITIASGAALEKKIVIIMGLPPEIIEQRLFS